MYWKNRCVTTYKNVFEIINEAHSHISHASDVRKNKKTIDESWYGVPESAMQMYLSMCPECIASCRITKTAKMNSLKMILSNTVGSCAQMDLINMSSQEFLGYKWILHYHNHHSGFAHVGIMTTKNAKGCGQELMKILSTAIIPEVLQSDNGREFLPWRLNQTN